MTGIRRLRLPAGAVLTALLALPASSSPAGARSLSFAAGLGGGSAPARAGLLGGTPRRDPLTAVVSQGTGLVASRVAAEHACPAPRPGHAACQAQVIVIRASRRVAHPTVRRDATFRIRTGRNEVGTRLAPAAGTSTSAAPLGAHTPAWLQQAYDLTYLSETRGGTDTIAIVDSGNDPTAAADLANFRSYWGLPACTTASGCFTQVGETGS